jgi:hypothetical protein
MAQETEKDLERNPQAELDEAELDEVSGGRPAAEQERAPEEDRLIGGHGVQPDQLPHP